MIIIGVILILIGGMFALVVGIPEQNTGVLIMSLVFAALGAGLIVLKKKASSATRMKIGGIVFTSLGVLMVVFGAYANQRVMESANLYMKYGSEPGNGSMVFGVMTFAVGVILLVMHHSKKDKDREK